MILVYFFALIKIAVPILAIIFLIKGIKFLNKKNAEKNKD